jgi:hypothetical protein
MLIFFKVLKIKMKSQLQYTGTCSFALGSGSEIRIQIPKPDPRIHWIRIRSKCPQSWFEAQVFSFMRRFCSLDIQHAISFMGLNTFVVSCRYLTKRFITMLNRTLGYKENNYKKLNSTLTMKIRTCGLFRPPGVAVSNSGATAQSKLW